MEKLAAVDPQHIGTYRLLARLGAGAVGPVYLARSEWGRTVALRLIQRQLAAQEGFRSLFRQEVAAARRISSPWTAQVLDADTEAESPWLVTGYVAGPTLRSVVSGGHGPMPESSVRVLAGGLTQALRDIHAVGLVHRGLKPSNVLVTVDGPCVIDFGLAHPLDVVTGLGPEPGTGPGGPTTLLTPEQVRGGRLSAAGDVFCLGAVLTYAATGHLPFAGTDGPAGADRLTQGEPDLSALPEGLTELMQACLRKNPAGRPTTTEILTWLEQRADAAAEESWLPAPLLSELGQHAVQLLEHDDPERRGATAGGPAAPVESAPWVAPGVHGMPTTIVAAAEPAAHPAPTGQAPAPGTLRRPSIPPLPQLRQPLPPPRPYPQQPGTQQRQQAYRAPAQDATEVLPLVPPGRGAPPPPDGAVTHRQEPYAPEPYAPEPVRRRGTRGLITAAAVLVAIAVGGTVYLLNSGGTKDNRAGSASTVPAPTSSAPRPRTPATATPSATEQPQGDVPKRYVGTWTGHQSGPVSSGPRRLVIKQGAEGAAVLSLTADGKGYHCVFQAPLTSRPGEGAALSIGPSKVVTARPKTACTPGEPTRLTILRDGRLRRTTTDGETVTYTKEG